MPHEALPQCTASCSCDRGHHWRLEGAPPRDRFFWRIGCYGCEHDRHSRRGVAYWGVTFASADEFPGARIGSSGNETSGWYWHVVHNSEPSCAGWADSEADVLQVIEEMFASFEGTSQRCDLVALDDLRHMSALAVRHERRLREYEEWKAAQNQAAVSEQLDGDPEWCTAWCSCPGTHWRQEGATAMWRPGRDGCTHPRHDRPGAVVWGLSAADLSDPVVHAVSGARPWFWCVLRSGELAEHGWSDTARWAAGTCEGVACGMERGAPRRGAGAVRCDLVAGQGWRRLVGLARVGEVSRAA